ncbi:unnamed protein product [Knipowitschia caucasica]
MDAGAPRVRESACTCAGARCGGRGAGGERDARPARQTGLLFVSMSSIPARCERGRDGACIRIQTDSGPGLRRMTERGEQGRASEKERLDMDPDLSPYL